MMNSDSGHDDTYYDKLMKANIIFIIVVGMAGEKSEQRRTVNENEDDGEVDLMLDHKQDEER